MKKLFGTIICLTFLITAVHSQTISDFSPSSYTEFDGWKTLDTSVSVSYSSKWDGGYIEFSVTNTLDTADYFRLLSGTTYTLSGRLLLDSQNDTIGYIDSVFNGLNGNKLRINFNLYELSFLNPSFESGLTGWTVLNQRIDLGTDSIAGFPTVESDPYPGNTSNKDNNVPVRATFSTQFSTDKTEGTQSLRLFSDNVLTLQGCDVVHGPAIISDTFTVNTAAALAFDWKAAAGGDDFDIYGYLLNVSNGDITEMINQNGGVTNWSRVGKEIPANGDYRFVFVNGTHDLSCGRVAGASLFLDNFRLYELKYVSNAIVEDIIEHVEYKNDCVASLTKDISIVVESGVGSKATVSGSFSIIAVTAPVIVSQPSDTTGCAGDGASFGLAIQSGGVVQSYQWQENDGVSGWNNVSGANFSGINSDTLEILSLDTLMDGYRYRCIVTGTNCFKDTTSSVVLRVFRLPLITLEPIQPESKCGGDSINLTVGSYGSNLTYLWQRNNGSGWFNIPGATQPSYKLTQLSSVDNGAMIRCVVDGECAPADTSMVITLLVRGDRPIVTVISKTPPSPGQSNGSIDVDVSNYNQFILNSRWTYKDDVHFENTNSGFDLTNAKAADYYLMLITREYCIYYDGPHPLR